MTLKKKILVGVAIYLVVGLTAGTVYASMSLPKGTNLWQELQRENQ